MEEDGPPKKRGRKKVYDSSKGYDRGAPRLATRVDPDVLDWVASRQEEVRPYLERLVRFDRYRQSIRVRIPRELVVSPKLKPAVDNFPDHMQLQVDLSNYVIQIIAASDKAPWQYGTGFLVTTSDGIGYLLTCSHNFCRQKLRWVCGIRDKELTSELESAAVFGGPVLDEEADLAYLPVLQPDVLARQGKLFCPLSSETANPLMLVANGYPGKLSSNTSFEKGDWLDKIAQVSYVATLFEHDERKIRNHKSVTTKFPSATIGFAIEPLPAIDSVTSKKMPLPMTLGGMSGGPMWGIFEGGSIRPVGVLAAEYVEGMPTEIYGIPVERAQALLSADPFAKLSNIP